MREMRIGLVVAVVLAGVLCGIAGEARAVPFVQAGSTYRTRLFTASPGAFTRLDASPTFDGVAENFVLASGGQATVTESETFLGGGKSLVTITIEADEDLFPDDGNGNAASWNFGGGNPLDLSVPVMATGAIQMFNGVGGLVAGNSNLLILNPDPWDGTQPSGGTINGFGNTVGLDIQTVVFEFTLMAAIPEPLTASLGLMGLGGLAAVTRRRGA